MELRQTAENSAKVMRRTQAAMEFYLQVLAAEAELAFSKIPADPAIFYDPATQSFETLAGEGIPLGVEESWVYAENQKAGL